MSIATVTTRALCGIEARSVAVEAHLSNGLPSFTLVGLPETTVKESRERVRSAIVNSGFEFPRKRITVNLAPADLPKQGGRYDLAIAIALLVASHQVSPNKLAGLELLGELALDGSIRAVSGQLAAAIQAGTLSRALLCAKNPDCSATLSKTKILQAETLTQACNFLNGKADLFQPSIQLPSTITPLKDLSDIIGQESAKRALCIAACGKHHLLMYGPPGAGKSMLAQKVPQIMPKCSNSDALEIQIVYNSIAKSLPFGERPFRAPHHSTSAAALIGGSNPPKPGEITLAHKGVLFLDELAEFPRHILDHLREPIETKKIVIARSGNQACFPADFQLIAATNPCPCGYNPSNKCRCTPAEVARYQARLSGPLMDRFDLSIAIAPVPFSLMTHEKPAAKTDELPDIKAIQKTQLARQGELNGVINSGDFERYCPLSTPLKEMLAKACNDNDWTMRSWNKLHRVAQTIADIEGSPVIESPHLAEAIHYRKSIHQK